MSVSLKVTSHAARADRGQPPFRDQGQPGGAPALKVLYLAVRNLEDRHRSTRPGPQTQTGSGPPSPRSEHNLPSILAQLWLIHPSPASFGSVASWPASKRRWSCGSVQLGETRQHEKVAVTQVRSQVRDGSRPPARFG
jgi:hypothetical protein